MSAIVDGGGIYGCVFHYSMVIAIVGSSFLLFMYLWRKGKLDMDEEPKLKMMEDEGTNE